MILNLQLETAKAFVIALEGGRRGFTQELELLDILAAIHLFLVPQIQSSSSISLVSFGGHTKISRYLYNFFLFFGWKLSQPALGA